MKLKDKSPSLKNKINNTSIQTNKNFILNILHLNNKGYDKVCEFLRDECGNSISVSRRSTIALKQVTQKKEVKQNAEKKTSVSKVNPAKKTKLNQQIQPYIYLCS